MDVCGIALPYLPLSLLHLPCSSKHSLELRVMKIRVRDHFIRLVGKVAQIHDRRVNISTVLVNHHRELDSILEVIYNIGEAANVPPLKGIVGIIRSVLGQVKV
jgi:hypothetical protein